MKRKELTYKTKYQLWIVSLAMVVLMIYVMSIRPTISLCKEYKSLRQPVQLLTNNQIQWQIDSLARLLSKDSVANQQFLSQDFQGQVIQVISKAGTGSKVSIIQLEPVVTPSAQDQIHQLEIKGEFSDLLAIIYHLEQNNMGVISAGIHLSKATRNQPSSLRLHCYLNARYRQINNQ